MLEGAARMRVRDDTGTTHGGGFRMQKKQLSCARWRPAAAGASGCACAAYIVLPTHRVQPESRQTTMRFDMFSCVHKAQRYAMCEAMLQVSSLNPYSAPDVVYVLKQVNDMLDYHAVLIDHVAVHVVYRMEMHAPGSSDAVARLCSERRLALARMRDVHHAASALGDRMSGETLAALQQHLNAFVARALNRMDSIAREVNRVLRRVLPDEALAGFEEAMVTAPAPGALRCSMQWMLPALNPDERLRLHAVLGRRLGPDFAAATLAMGKDLLSRDDFRHLQRESVSREAALA
jgi:hypothetical protein